MSRVEVYAAKIPFIGAFAVHCWLVVDGRDRFEVWQSPNLNAQPRHLHFDLLSPRQGVGNGPAWRLAEFEGEEAARIVERLTGAADSYPFCERYRYWPGPNSNTFAQWALGESFRLPWRAFGRNFRVRSDDTFR